ncbi:MAG: hypothetical protein V1797_11980 [Pseudomonadota bacterium]
MPRRLRTPLLLVLLAALLGLAASLRVVRVSGDRAQATLALWAWQDGGIEFTNSITGRPVAISFGLPWHFSGFSARTEPGTEEYYTNGQYAWNQRLAGEARRALQCCSEVGITVRLGGRRFHEAQGGCVRLDLVWPPF